MDSVYATTKTYYNFFGSATKLWPCGIPFLVYYIGYHKRAAMRSNEFLAERIRVIRLFHSIFDSYFARRFTLKVLPRLGIMSQLQTAKACELNRGSGDCRFDRNRSNNVVIVVKIEMVNEKEIKKRTMKKTTRKRKAITTAAKKTTTRAREKCECES